MPSRTLRPGSPWHRQPLCRLETEAPGEDRQAAKERLLSRAEQVIAPGDGIAHGLLASREVAAAAGQQEQALLQPVQQRGRGTGRGSRPRPAR